MKVFRQLAAVDPTDVAYLR